MRKFGGSQIYRQLKPGESIEIGNENERPSWNLADDQNLKDVSMINLDDSVRNSIDNMHDEEGDANSLPPPIKFNQLCKLHPRELVVAFGRITLDYLCNKCIGQQGLNRDHYQVYPQAVQNIKEKLECARKLAKFKQT